MGSECASRRHQLGLSEDDRRYALRKRDPKIRWDFWNEAEQTGDPRARFHDGLSAWFWLPGSELEVCGKRIVDEGRAFLLPERRQATVKSMWQKLTRIF